MSLNIRIECLREPNLSFGGNQKDIEPRRVMAKHGAADKSAPRELRIGIVGPAAEVQIARAWLPRLNRTSIAREKSARRYPHWPGAQQRLQREEEQEQMSLFQPTPEELKAAEELRTQAEDLLFRLLILDEAHVYEGVFGTNMAYLMRRLDSVSATHQVLCSTATLGRPADFVYQLTGRQALSIDQSCDGSSAPARDILLACDPGFEGTVNLLRRLATLKGRFLAFGDSRKMVEQIVAATLRVVREEEDEDEEEDGVEPDDQVHRIEPD